MSTSLIPQNLQRRKRRELFSIWPTVFPQWGLLGSSVVKNPCARVGDVIQSLDWEDPLEKEMATHSSILAGKFRGQRNLVGYSPWGHKRVRHDWSDLTTAAIFLVSFLSSDFVTMKITVVWPMLLVISYVIWAGLLFGLHLLSLFQTRAI